MGTGKHQRIDLSNGASATLPLMLLGIFAMVVAISAISPTSREDWLLENALVALALPLLLWGWTRVRLSNAAYVLLIVFGVLHEIGAHYQYSDVPYEQWFAAISGGGSLDALFGFERNQFDRVVHFLYGVLATPALVELVRARMRPRGLWVWILALSLVLSQAALYELLEWAAALLFGGDLGEAYLGTQGDPWDAHQDMALAPLGALLTLVYLRLRGHLHNPAVQTR